LSSAKQSKLLLINYYMESVTMKLTVIELTFLLFISLCQIVYGQSDSEEADELRKIRLKDGTELVGTILSEDSTSVKFLSISQIEMVIPRDQLKSIEVFTGEIVHGVIRAEDPNRTRLFFAPTARALGHKNCYISDYQILFTFFGVGVTDYINLTGGISLIPSSSAQLYYVAPKVIPVQGKNYNLAAGVLYISTTIGGLGAGLVYGAGTFGNTSKAITVGAGWGYLEDEFSHNALLLLGGEFQLSKSLKFITENWIPMASDAQLLSFGIRFFGPKVAGDLAFYYPTGTGMSGFPFIPWLGFAYHFSL